MSTPPQRTAVRNPIDAGCRADIGLVRDSNTLDPADVAMKNCDQPDRASAELIHSQLQDVKIELWNTAVLIAITGGIFNDLASTRSTSVSSIVAAYLPPRPYAFSKHSAALRSHDGIGKLPSVLDALYSDVDRASRFSKQIARAAQGGHVLTVSSVAAGSRYWQDCAVHCLKALRLIEVSIEQLDPNSAARYRRLALLLSFVRRGKSSCLPDAETCSPSPLERRSDRRVVVDLNVTIESRKGRQTAVLTNISTGGLGVAGDLCLEWDERVTTVLHAGRRLVGRVTWVLGRRAGIELQPRLLPHDALFLEGGIGGPPT